MDLPNSENTCGLAHQENTRGWATKKTHVDWSIRGKPVYLFLRLPLCEYLDESCIAGISYKSILWNILPPPPHPAQYQQQGHIEWGREAAVDIENILFRLLL